VEPKYTQRPLLPTITGETRFLYQSSCQATCTGKTRENQKKKNQCEIQESLIISARGGDEKMRWRKKIEQRRSMRTKRPAVVKREKEEA